MQFEALQKFGREFTPALGRQAPALRRRAADLRPVHHRRGDRQGAAAPGRPEVGRLPDHRPDRGADDGRRQHRRLRRRAQLRRHDLQDQPRGGAGDRAPAAPAQPRRHHHPRLHRHDARGPPHRGARRAEEAARARPHQGHGQRLHPARAGRDDEEAHPRVARPHAVRAVPDLPGPRRGEDRAQRLLRHPARDPARGAPVQPEGVPRRRLGLGGRDAARRGEPAPGRPVRLHRQADLAAGRAVRARRSSTTSSCCEPEGGRHRRHQRRRRRLPDRRQPPAGGGHPAAHAERRDAVRRFDRAARRVPRGAGAPAGAASCTASTTRRWRRWSSGSSRVPSSSTPPLPPPRPTRATRCSGSCSPRAPTWCS